MKVTIELDEHIVSGIAYSNAHKAAGGWWESCTNDYPSEYAEHLYAAAFADGMNYLLDLIKKGE